MNAPPREVVVAREVLRKVSVPLGARERVLRAVLHPPRRQARPQLTLGGALVLLLVASSAAAFGLAAASWLGLLRPAGNGHAVTGSLEPKRSPAPAGRRAEAMIREPVTAPVPSTNEPVAASPRIEPERSVVAHAAGHPLPTASTANGASSLALQVAAYKDASALVARRPADAVTKLDAFRRTFPSSPLLPEAQVRLIQALGALGRTEDARREARDFLVRYPASTRRAELEALVGDPSKNQDD